ncbi:hypothetical protein BN2476_420099 [Paraburkholderia piptadeniae]|uniref:Uncharacterized protein n=1 Tax=Paraburkholderia piptadeniae TaxID=1701573 RepID=A0A1N7SB62_9BURK|nr:hypothetical protein BN2476_420099 [Paraburkholderia piptadeniae]
MSCRSSFSVFPKGLFAYETCMRCPVKGRSQGLRRSERPFTGQPLTSEFIHSRGTPETGRMAASRVVYLARPNGAPCSLPCARFRAFACTFHMQTDPK